MVPCATTASTSRRAVEQLLAAAAAAGLMVFTDGDRLVVRGPRSTDPALVRELLARKPELLHLLRQPVAESDRERFEERAAIAEYDGGLSRPAAEWVARAELWCSDRPDR